MKRRQDRREAVREALQTLLNSIEMWPMEYKDFEKLVEETYAKFH